jgi:zinc transport system ATP-binding protein
MLGHKNNSNNFFKKVGFWYKQDEINCAKNSLKLVGMQDYYDQKIANLSGGQRQRVMCARALCNHPDLLILDEPTANIDIQGQKEIFELLQQLNKTLTIIIVSHDIQILNYAKNAAFINKTITYHNLNNITKIDTNEHFCEVELLQMLGQKND